LRPAKVTLRLSASGTSPRRLLRLIELLSDSGI
jgi:hypothetical protein